MFDAIVYKVPAGILIDIYRHPRTTVPEVARRLNSHFATIAENVDFLEYRKLIKSVKEGRCRYLELTRKGKAIARNLIAIRKMLPG